MRWLISILALLVFSTAIAQAEQNWGDATFIKVAHLNEWCRHCPDWNQSMITAICLIISMGMRWNICISNNAHMCNDRADLSPSELNRMAEQFCGYGKWDAPYWFVGPEAGMGRDGNDSLAARYESWKQLGCAPIVDCAAHHRGFGFTKWHQPHPPTQPTWRQLIRLLLAYKGMNPDLDDIRAYQRDHWGRENGETCAIELSGLPAPNLQTSRDRTTFLSKRIERIRKAALKYAPEFIVMYGQGNRREWERIAGGGFDSSGLYRMGKTVAAIALHPVTRGLGNECWVRLGRMLREAADHKR
jgi:hypothetical protein